jgi:hypothetical protein
MRGKDKRRLIYMQMLQVWRFHLAIESGGTFLPPNTLEASPEFGSVQYRCKPQF